MTSIMSAEAHSTPQVISTQLVENISVIKKLTAHLQKNPPPYVVTIARGSSDHAAYYGQYLFAIENDLNTSSMPPSISSLYHRQIAMKNVLAIGISQSGASPDICAGLQMAKEGGATTVAIVNNTNSLLANIADFVIPLHAGPEKAVAATKSYIASLSVLVQLSAHISGNRQLLKRLPQLPERLQQSLEVDWQPAIEALQEAVNLIVLGRGLCFPITQEAALKFKETANIHAESFSSAEFQHGPMALARPDFPLFAFAQQGPALPSTLALMTRMKSLGSKTLLAAARNIDTDNHADIVLPLPESLHPACDPLVSIQAFYPMMAELAIKRGYDPDAPDNLQKVTETQ